MNEIHKLKLRLSAEYQMMDYKNCAIISMSAQKDLNMRVWQFYKERT